MVSRQPTRFGPVAVWPLALALTALVPLPVTGQSGPTAAQEANVRIYVVDLVEVDGSAQTFYADVFVSATWDDPSLASPDGSVRILSPEDAGGPQLVVVNQRGLSNSLPDVVRVDGSGNAARVMRLTGTFSARMSLSAFPRDRQRFDVWVVAPPLGGERWELNPEPTELRLIADSLSISDWSLEAPELASRPYTATPDALPISGVVLTIEAERKLGYYLIQVLLPLCAVVLMAWTVFWIDPAVVTTRVGVVVTTMLTLIAYRFMLGNLVPRLSYLTRLDYFMLCVTSLVVLTLLTMAGCAFLKSCGKDDAVKRIDQAGRVLYPAALATITLVIWVF